MTENPYESPKSQPDAMVAEASLRKQARRSLHISALLLSVPAVVNFWAFDTRFVAALPKDLANFSRMANAVGFVAGFVLFWQLSLPTLEAVARLLRAVFASATDRTAWLDVLHRSLTRISYLAIVGAALWMIWMFGFYQVHNHTISVVVSVAAHLLGACWYVPLAYRWYRLAVSPTAVSTPQTQGLDRYDKEQKWVHGLQTGKHYGRFWDDRQRRLQKLLAKQAKA